MPFSGGSSKPAQNTHIVRRRDERPKSEQCSLGRPLKLRLFQKVDNVITQPL